VSTPPAKPMGPLQSVNELRVGNSRYHILLHR